MVVEAKLNDSFMGELAARGYTALSPIGSGHTSEVYRATYSAEGLIRPRIVKVEKLEGEIDQNSPTTRINMARKDVHANEITTSNRTSHPNIVDIQDCFIAEGRRVIVEEDIGGQSLEDLVEAGGPITDPRRFSKIFSGVIDGLEHLHHDEGLLHKDMKPSNIVVGKTRGSKPTVKIIDLQNAGPIDSGLSVAPTRCGTAYANDHLLESILSGKKTRYTVSDDLYSLGATMYFALTGEPIHDRSLVQGDGSNIVQLADGTILPIALIDDGNVVANLDYAKSQKTVAKKIKKLPRRYRELVRTLVGGEIGWKNNSLFGIDTDVKYSKVREKLDRATKSKFKATLDNVIDNSKFFFGGLGLAAAIGGLVLTSMHSDAFKEAKEPTLSSILSETIFSPRQVTELYEEYGNETFTQLAEVYGEIRKFENRGFFSSPEKHPDANNMVKAQTEHALMQGYTTKRLGTALASALLISDHDELSDFYSNERFCGSFVPRDFVERLSNLGRGHSPFLYGEDNEEGCIKRECVTSRYSRCYDAADTKFHRGLKYLSSLVAVNGTPEKAFAEYFTSDKDRLIAQSMAGNTNYFNQDGENGYRNFLDPVQRAIIDKAIAFYYITDNEGIVHTQILDDSNIPSRGLDAKYSCFIDSEE